LFPFGTSRDFSGRLLSKPCIKESGGKPYEANAIDGVVGDARRDGAVAGGLCPGGAWRRRTGGWQRLRHVTM